MRQLNAVGWMCYRNRLITSNFLVKNLHVNWQLGEEYFARKLVDADQPQNNAGWQWTASTGSESQPYFQFFKASNQTTNFDPDCKFVKEWVPELASLKPNEIIEWESTHKKHANLAYPAPIVFHDASRLVTMQLYKTSLELSGKIRDDYVAPPKKEKAVRGKSKAPEKAEAEQPKAAKPKRVSKTQAAVQASKSKRRGMLLEESAESEVSQAALSDSEAESSAESSGDVSYADEESEETPAKVQSKRRKSAATRKPKSDGRASSTSAKPKTPTLPKKQIKPTR